jgi:two-component system phosphate regulon response regulator PhoB
VVLRTDASTVWIVEDAPDIRELVQYHLEREGFGVACESTIEGMRARLKRGQPSLLLLDLMLPDGNGLDFCRELRRNPATAGIPVIMLTARDEDTDVIVGLEVGADDYVTKPFSAKILLARIRAILRRRAGTEERAGDGEIVTRGALTIDRQQFVAMLAGQPLTLTRSEFMLLLLLARRPGVVFSRYQIVDGVHGADYPVTDRSVDVLVVSLRRKLGGWGHLIETVRGVGYRFKAGQEPT